MVLFPGDCGKVSPFGLFVLSHQLENCTLMYLLLINISTEVEVQSLVTSGGGEQLKAPHSANNN